MWPGLSILNKKTKVKKNVLTFGFYFAQVTWAAAKASDSVKAHSNYPRFDYLSDFLDWIINSLKAKPVAHFTLSSTTSKILSLA